MTARTLALWCPDWPVVAATREASRRAGVEDLLTDGGYPAEPVAVVAVNRVVACSAQARTEGVRRGMRRRDAVGCCPGLVVHDADPARDARWFEQVVCAVDDVAADIEVLRPGLIVLPARGPAGYFGSLETAVYRLLECVVERAGVRACVGVADGAFAAALAARRSLVIDVDRAAEFLADINLSELVWWSPTDENSHLVEVLRRLGIYTLGKFGQLTERDVLARFGRDAVVAHRLARGLRQRPLSGRRPRADLSVSVTFDPPLERVDAAVFAGRGIATRLHACLADHGVACARMAVYVVTETGQRLGRVWRSAEPLTPMGIAERVRWQLDGWLSSPDAPTAGIVELRAEPLDLITGAALQLELESSAVERSGRVSASAVERSGRVSTLPDRHAERAEGAMVRVQGLLGTDAVCTPVPAGGRGPVERVRWIPWGDSRDPPTDSRLPWPGRLPSPSPTLVVAEGPRVAVLDASGAPVSVDDAGEFCGVPVGVVPPDGRVRAVLAWAGPWPVDEAWWSGHGRRRVRMQALMHGEDGDGGVAVLLVWENGAWMVEGRYD